jgi:hypothetical protein
MTTAVREPRVAARVPAYVTAAQRRGRRAVLLNEGPWRKRDRTVVIAGCGVGLLGLGLCSWKGSGEVDLSNQIDWLLGGILCVAVSSVSLAYWLMSGLRTVRGEMAQVFTTVRPAYPVATAAATGTGFVTVAGMVRYHRPECPLVAGKTIRQVDPAEGLRPCGACDAGEGAA